MALTKVTYTDNVTVIGADNLNDIQDEIIANGETSWNHIGELSNSGDSITFNVPVGASGILVIDEFRGVTNNHLLYIHPFFRESWGINVGNCPFAVSTDYSFTVSDTDGTITVTLSSANWVLRIASIGTNKLTVEE